MRIVKRTVVPLILLGLVALPASAWNKPGHMISAAIAYDDLRETNNEAVQAIVKILFGHQDIGDWNERLLRLYEYGEDRERLLFMLVARWPDDVRGTPEHVRDWHFINHPYKNGKLSTSDSIGGQAYDALEEQIVILKHSESTRKEKAKALSWIFHVIGDLHQPLHSVALVNDRLPKGDAGGNALKIRHPVGFATSLHSYWDSSVLYVSGTDLEMISKAKIEQISDRAAALRARTAFQRENLEEYLQLPGFRNWAKKESAPIAVELVYEHPDLEWSYSEEDAPEPPDGYEQEVREAGEKRMALAGLRLADLLAEWFATP